MKKLTKFVALSPIGILALGGAAALAISCGESTTDNTISILVESARADKQTVAWEAIVNKYNELFPDNPRKFSIKTFAEASYTSHGLGQGINDAYNSGDAWRYNLIYSYPAPLARIASLKRTLPLVASTDVTTVRNLFNSDVMRSNDQITGVEAGNFYILPLAKSSEALYINKPLAARLFKVAKDNGYLSADTDKTKEIDAIIAEQAALGTDSDYAKLSDTTSPWQVAANPTQGANQFDDSIFNDTAALLDFSSTIRELFAIKPAGNYKAQEYNIYGIDSGANFFYAQTTALAKVTSENPNFADTLWGIGTDKKPSYSFLTNATSKARQNFDTVYNAVKRGLETEALYFKYAAGSSTSATYPTVPLQQHRLAFALGSTSGYYYSFDGTTQKPETLQQTEMQLNRAPKIYGADSSPVNILQGRSLFGYRSDDETVNTEIQKFVKWMIEGRADFAETTLTIGTRQVPIKATTKPISPAERFDQIAGYLYATKANVEGTLDKDYFNPAVIQTADLVRYADGKETPSKKVYLLEDPIDLYANPVRDSIDNAIVEEMKQENINPTQARKTAADVIADLLKRYNSLK